MADLQKLFEIHEIMENYIKKASNIEEDSLGKENVFDLRYLALQVKVGELANLTKCYKYARIKENLPKDKLMTRYIDALQFLLSIGNINDFNIIGFDNILGVKKDSSIIKVFSNIYQYICDVRELARRDRYFDALNAYVRLVEEFVKLADHLGFTMDEVSARYHSAVCEITKDC